MRKKKARTKSGRLVIGHLERISSDIFEKYNSIITGIVGGRYGIYALYRNKRLYYVGLATDLKRRVNHHLRDRHKGKWNYFSLYLARSERFLKDLECLAIRIAYPKGNKTRGKFGGVPDLRRMLKRQIKTQVIDEIDTILGRFTFGLAKRRKSRSRSAEKAAGIAAVATKRKSKSQIPLKGLLSRKHIRAVYKGKEYIGSVYSSGRIRLKHLAQTFDSPSGAGTAVRQKHTDGWFFWHYKNNDGEWVPLDSLRKSSR